jgi:hypothetical protein
MTTAPTENSKTHGLSTAFPAGPWTGRNLDQSETIVREFLESAAAEKAAIARHAQSKSRLMDAWKSGQLDGHQDICDENLYQFPGVDFVVKNGVKSYPIEAYSESTQALIKKERLNGAFRIGEKTLRAKIHND